MLTRKSPMANYGIMQYKKGSHVKINKYLRRIKNSRIEDAVTEFDEGRHDLMLRMIRSIDGAMKQRGEGDLYNVLLRGCGYMDFGIRSSSYDTLKSLEGKNKTWWAYTSATTNEIVARRFSKGVLIVINTAPTTSLIDLKKFSGLACQGEDEVLLARGSRFHIDSVDRAEDGCAVVTVTLSA